MAARWIEHRFERLIWKFRLISIVPVVLSLLESVGCFVIGAVEVFNAFLVIMRLPFTTKSVAAKTIAQMVGGVDYFVIGIALLIFGYGIYELVISDLDPLLEGGEEQHTNILSVNSLQSLQNNLSNVIVVGLIVAAFKKTIGFEVYNATDLLALCGSVAMLALSAWLIVRSQGAGLNDNTAVSGKTHKWTCIASQWRHAVNGFCTARAAADRPH
ncbi:YqhA family protein [Synechococcus sp. HIMB2401]|uniref:YqhA family protein n=1 Tax=Synechococcus sp. HIMB2401 TaxID=3144208 RepID=UPI0036F3BB84